MVEVYGETDDDPAIGFRPAGFLCSSCAKFTPAVVAGSGKMKCMFCDATVSLRREKAVKWVVTVLVTSGLVAVLAAPNHIADEQMLLAMVPAVVFLIAGLFVVRMFGDRIAQRFMPNFRLGSVSPKACLLLLTLGIMLHALAVFIFVSTPKEPKPPPDPRPATGAAHP